MATWQVRNEKQHPLSVVLKAMKNTRSRLGLFYVLLAFTALSLTLLELLPPMLLKRILDVNLKNGQIEQVWIAAFYYLAASMGSSIFAFAQTYLTTYIGQNILIDLRLLMAEHIAKLPMNYYNRTPVGEIMSYMSSDVDSVNTLFSSGLISGFTDMMKVFGIAMAMYVISPRLCFITLLSIPVLLIVANYFRKNILKAQMEIRKAVGKINTYLQELFNGIRIVKFYAKEDEYEKKFQTPLREHLKSIDHAAVFDSYFPCVMQTIKAIVIAAIVLLGAKTSDYDGTTVTIGSLAAFADLVSRLLSPVEALSQEFQTIQQAMAGLRRIVGFLGEEVEEKGKIQRLDNKFFVSEQGVSVTIRDISFGYAPDKLILKDVSLDIHEGKKVAIVGRTGAGKTSLMNLIAGLYKPHAGAISISGIDPYRLHATDRRKLIGIVPQSTHIFEGTLRENITLRDDRITQEEVEKAAKLVGLQDFIAALPDGYDTVIGVQGIKLSFGQSQLLSLARAVVCDPPVLLLDEPTSGMDALTEKVIFDAFRAIGNKRTIITISHRLSGVIDADEVYIMAAGKIVQSGSPDKLAGEKGWYSVFKQLEDLGWRLDV
ncbi:ATP-binding cassette subfamily B protein [Anaerosolibacter carboniphilus]|uniref:ATP-binding cassette subfamily B protein n=1 Tax=Anaerosolibacter carboniphilus TaxID=1417629 RepID=A0A841KS21_9FIRM|nr:ABC transporter ATP-binding protein [Anaerosolibacter carboniphilus]MBB6216193.1 ATP-binding cassette subfamily B protein [Anaerosolibacter carboniphilus]